jgi:hypothetical protein
VDSTAVSELAGELMPAVPLASGKSGKVACLQIAPVPHAEIAACAASRNHNRDPDHQQHEIEDTKEDDVT